MNHVYVISGNPTPLARPRFVKGHIWDSQCDIKIAVGWQLRSQRKEFIPYTQILSLDITFYMPIAKSAAKGKFKPGQYHGNKPDIDNLVKFALDAANGILFMDDKQIAQITAKKVYDMNPRTEFSLEIL